VFARRPDRNRAAEGTTPRPDGGRSSGQSGLASLGPGWSPRRDDPSSTRRRGGAIPHPPPLATPVSRDDECRARARFRAREAWRATCDSTAESASCARRARTALAQRHHRRPRPLASPTRWRERRVRNASYTSPGLALAEWPTTPSAGSAARSGALDVARSQHVVAWGAPVRARW
jgi:hypothetical protein